MGESRRCFPPLCIYAPSPLILPSALNFLPPLSIFSLVTLSSALILHRFSVNPDVEGTPLLPPVRLRGAVHLLFRCVSGLHFSVSISSPSRLFSFSFVSVSGIFRIWGLFLGFFGSVSGFLWVCFCGWYREVWRRHALRFLIARRVFL